MTSVQTSAMSHAEANRTPEQLRCMEIWGGNAAIDRNLEVSGLNAWVYARPFNDAAQGGDIHYVSSCGHGHISRFFVADVSGHGDHVSLLGGQLRRLMRRNINKLDQTRFVRALNTGFEAAATDGRFATALLTSFYAPTRQLLVCNAGHPQPLWYRAAPQSWKYLDHAADERIEKIRNLPLGIIDPTVYYQFAVQLDPGDIVLLFTDWLVEAQNPRGEFLGTDGLRRLVEGLAVSTPEQLGRDLLAAVDAFRGHAPPDDDATLVVLQATGAAPKPMSLSETVRVLGKVLGIINY